MSTEFEKWGIEQTSNMLWIGPMRSDGEKVDDVVVALNYDAELTDTAKVRQLQRARLFAAAPELPAVLTDAMEALAMCHPRTDHGARCQSNAMLKARAAIAKATGQ